MHWLDLKPVVAKRHRAKQIHSVLFWDRREGKYAGYLLHQEKSKHHLENPSSPTPKSQLHTCYRTKVLKKTD